MRRIKVCFMEPRHVVGVFTRGNQYATLVRRARGTAHDTGGERDTSTALASAGPGRGGERERRDEHPTGSESPTRHSIGISYPLESRTCLLTFKTHSSTQLFSRT